MVSWCCECGAGSRRQAAGCSSIHQIYQNASASCPAPCSCAFRRTVQCIHPRLITGHLLHLFLFLFSGVFFSAKKSLKKLSVASRAVGIARLKFCKKRPLIIRMASVESHSVPSEPAPKTWLHRRTLCYAVTHLQRLSVILARVRCCSPFFRASISTLNRANSDEPIPHGR